MNDDDNIDDIDTFYSKIIVYLDAYRNDYEYIISSTIRDIKLNNVVYVYDKWFQYNIETNKWVPYNFDENIITQLNKFKQLFNTHLVEYLNKNKELTTNNINQFKRVCYGIVGYIEHNELNLAKIKEYCQKLFSISI